MVHLAARAGVRPSIAEPALYSAVNVQGTVNVLECCRQQGVRYLVFGSSSSVYGARQRGPFAESDDVSTPVSPYAATKRAGELLCYTYAHLFALRIACLRFFTVYGPRQRPDLVIHKFARLLLQDRPLPIYGDGTAQRDYTYIDDIVDGIVRACAWLQQGDTGQGVCEIFNLGGAHPVPLLALVRLLEEALGPPRPPRLAAGTARRRAHDLCRLAQVSGAFGLRAASGHRHRHPALCRLAPRRRADRTMTALDPSGAILVTGGAGYIGSHTTKLLRQRGYRPVVYDSLASGCHRVPGVPLVEGEVHDVARLEATLRQYRVQAVLHFAASAYVGESVQDPLKYYHNNVAGSIALLRAMRAAGVSRLILSSTCATYGMPQQPLLTEEHPQQPVNPYGESKLFVERMLQACGTAYGLRWISLRYFNAAGADPEGELGEAHDPETHLIPLVLAVASGRLPHIAIFGDDYDTPDGTCIRDYIHVWDLAEAHLLALEALDDSRANTAYNLGTGRGYSVRQVIDTACHVTGRPIPTVVAPRRPGDPPRLVAAADKARRALRWTPRLSDLETILATAWQWECRQR
ncbi:MAG: hypothetical protein KatS3mg131_0364 [Candidatus Tectimicrobiota bacterium]|nr:MAG: hypothetical protein KatS3mg131_0364 [Candidatus Tectomicrobia bacterium]